MGYVSLPEGIPLFTTGFFTSQVVGTGISEPSTSISQQRKVDSRAPKHKFLSDFVVGLNSIY